MVRDEELARRLVVRRGSGGNCTYSWEAKRELVELCESGVASVAKVAQTYGVNPNQLHNWIGLHRKERLIAPAASHPDALEHSSVAVGTEVTSRPPHRSVLAELPHTAPTSGVTHRSAPLDMGAYSGAVGQTGQQSD